MSARSAASSPGGQALGLLEHLHVGAQAGDRRAQLVAGVRHQLALRLHRALERVEGGVEAAREAGELVPAHDLHALRGVRVGGQLLGARGEARDRRERRAGHERAERGAEGHARRAHDQQHEHDRSAGGRPRRAAAPPGSRRRRQPRVRTRRWVPSTVVSTRSLPGPLARDLAGARPSPAAPARPEPAARALRAAPAARSPRGPRRARPAPESAARRARPAARSGAPGTPGGGPARPHSTTASARRRASRRPRRAAPRARRGRRPARPRHRERHRQAGRGRDAGAQGHGSRSDVAHAAHGVQQRARARLLELAPQVADVDAQRVRGRAEVVAPHAVVDQRCEAAPAAGCASAARAAGTRCASARRSSPPRARRAARCPAAAPRTQRAGSPSPPLRRSSARRRAFSSPTSNGLTR